MVAGEGGFVVEGRQRKKTIAELAEWVRQQTDLVAAPALPFSIDWMPLGGDAGFRHYFRLPSHICLNAKPLLAVWAPPSTEKNTEFLKVARFLRQHGIHTPEIFALHEARGFMLIEDLGDELLFKHLNREKADTFYITAFEVLFKLTQCPIDTAVCPVYSKRELLRELHLFPQWFVSRLLGYSLTADESAMLEQVFEQLCLSALEQPRVIVHRDYHSRNLLLMPEGELGVIDFQDAVVGPVTYDLVSLLRDCYVEWPAEQVWHWVDQYAARLRASGQLSEIDDQTFRSWFDWMGLQRHIKVLGIFARLYLRDGKDAYLQDLPLVIRYVRAALSRYPELEPFGQWFDRALMPLIRNQAWMVLDD